jgi:hypothetical protein
VISVGSTNIAGEQNFYKNLAIKTVKNRTNPDAFNVKAFEKSGLKLPTTHRLPSMLKASDSP